MSIFILPKINVMLYFVVDVIDMDPLVINNYAIIG